MKTGIELISEERQRQISQEGWTPEHDDTHRADQLARAAAAYAAGTASVFDSSGVWIPVRIHLWPFEPEALKPIAQTFELRIRELSKAGALIAAEIDRLQRATKQPATTKP